MSVTLIHDFHNLAFRTLFLPVIGVNSQSPNYNEWKFIIFNNIYLSLYKHRNVSEVIVATDHYKSWRKMFWPRYKESRVTQREKSDINWTEVFKHLSDFINALIEYTPFKVLNVENCEGDDIFAVITANGDKNRKYILISTDEDFKQLIQNNVILYNPLRKQYESNKDIEKYLEYTFLKGQSKDNIFNILTPSDYPCGNLGKKRKPALGDKKIEKIIQYGKEKWINDNRFKYQYDFDYIDLDGNTKHYICETNDLQKNYERNIILISFDRIPSVIRQRILTKYSTYKLPMIDKLYKLWEKYKWDPDLYDQIERKLVTLY